jgi:cytochrome c biogenesis protein CcmG, thiol:disulfide interchange protein DsbE
MAVGLRRAGQVLAIAVVLALLSVLVWRVVRDSEGGAADALRRGEHPQAPAFDLERLDAPGRLQLSSLRGKAVVLNFWASWCLPCKEEAPRLEAAWQKWRSKGVVVVGIDANDFKSDARRFARRYELTYPLVHDGPGELLDDYGLSAFPETFFVRPDGRLSSWTQGELSEAEIEAGIKEALAT